MSTTGLDFLFRVEAPIIHVGPGESERLPWTASHFYSRPRLDVGVRVLRGHKMRSVPALMDEFAAAFQFFPGFGENWPALTECLSYLDEWLPADAYVLVVERADELLADDEADIPALLRALDGAGRFWSEPVIDNGRFDRPARPFHALLMVPESNGAVVRRIRTAASSIDIAFD